MTTSGPARPLLDAKRPARLWLWFLAGFLIVFVVLLFFVTTHGMHPSGRGVVQSNLWHYYALRLPKLFSLEPQPLGPASGQSSEMIRALSEHVACSTLGGLVALAIGWKASRRRIQRANRK